LAALKTSLGRVGPSNLITPGSVKSQNFPSIKNWLAIISNARCSDPRDTVFAFHGCFSPEIRNIIDVDYTKSIEDILWQTTLAFVKTTGDLSIIAYGSKPQKLSTPTWTLNIGDTRKLGFPALQDSPPSIEKPLPLHQLQCCDRVLEVRGICLGMVEKIGPIFAAMDANIPFAKGTYFTDHLLQTAALLSGPAESEKFMCTALVSGIAGTQLRDKQIEKVIKLGTKSWVSSYKEDMQTPFAELSLFLRVRIARRHVGWPMFSFFKEGDCHFAIGDPGMLPGDIICVLFGCGYPVILRQQSEGHTVVGNASLLESIMEDAAKGVSIKQCETFCLM
jgi:hypothetical protein